MKKSFIAAGIAAALALSMLTGCAGDKQEGGAAVTPPPGEYSGGPMWGKPASKMVVNFEGRVAEVDGSRVTLEDGTVVLTDEATVSAPDGSAAEIAVGDYIQGYAENPDEEEIKASSILVTVL